VIPPYSSLPSYLFPLPSSRFGIDRWMFTCLLEIVGLLSLPFLSPLPLLALLVLLPNPNLKLTPHSPLATTLFLKKTFANYLISFVFSSFTFHLYCCHSILPSSSALDTFFSVSSPLTRRCTSSSSCASHCFPYFATIIIQRRKLKLLFFFFSVYSTLSTLTVQLAYQ
jgi:hypothetical protein